jgi:hypothetical protein
MLSSMLKKNKTGKGLEQDVRISSDGDLPTGKTTRRDDAVKSNWQWVDDDG